MRYALISAGLLLLVGSELLLAGDDGPISALAALAPSSVLAQTADQAPAGEKTEQKRARDEKTQAVTEDRPRRHRARRDRGHRGERARGRGVRPSIASWAEHWGRLPDDMKITITKSGKEPAEMTVVHGDKAWTVKDSNFQDLPPEVRRSVARFLGFGILSRLHGTMTGWPDRRDAGRQPEPDRRETRRHRGHRHPAWHARHLGPGRGRDNLRNGRAPRDFRLGAQRPEGMQRHEGFSRLMHDSRFAQHGPGGAAWFRRDEHPRPHVHRQLAMRRFPGPRFGQAAMDGVAFAPSGGRLEQLVSRLERLVWQNSPSSWTNRAAFQPPTESARPPMANWFGRNRPVAQRDRAAGGDNTAELREQIQRLQEQQERMAHALRDLSEALSRPRRD